MGNQIKIKKKKGKINSGKGKILFDGLVGGRILLQVRSDVEDELLGRNSD